MGKNKEGRKQPGPWPKPYLQHHTQLDVGADATNPRRKKKKKKILCNIQLTRKKWEFRSTNLLHSQKSEL